MFKPLLDEISWSFVHRETSPPDKFNHTIVFPLPFQSDVALVTVTSNQTNADWVRAGWVQQIWLRGDDEFLVARELVLLATSLVFPIEPVNDSVLTFEPVGWLLNWTIYAEAREYTPS